MISEYFCFLHSDNLPPSHNPSSRALPDLEIFWTACYGSNSYPKLPKGKGGGSMMIQKSLPKSFGTVRLSTEGANDVKIDPIVDPNLLSNPEDWITYRRGLLYARQIGAEMARGGYDISEVLMPRSSREEDLDEFIRNGALCSQHLLSSCRMKPLEEGGVVDFELRVYGIRGLRIADGSVFPGMVASRPQATVVMIAERCAEFIRREWSNWEFQSK
jgi:choline dehydrogenase